MDTLSFDRRIGFAGLVVAFFAIAAFYIWPEKKWIGWVSLGIAALLLLFWIVLEIVSFTVSRRKKTENQTHGPIISVDWPAKWKQIASDFSNLPSDTRADWYGQIGGDVPMVKNQWELRGGTKRKDSEALCRLAGAMLLRSPRIAPMLSVTVRVQNDDVWRWLYFIKGYEGVTLHTMLGDSITHGLSVRTAMHSIELLSSVSARVCVECSAIET